MTCIMQEIRLYQIPFSHFCDKVRWALDYYSIPYKTIDFIARQKLEGLEKAPSTLQKLVPIIEDPNNNSLFLSDSTPILLYLDEHYGNEKTLFPRNFDIGKDVIVQYCLKLDSQLGIYSRRLAYLYVINKKPAILSVLVDGNYNKTSCDDWKSYYSGIIGSCIVIARLGVHRIQEEAIFEKTISILDEIQENIQNKKYLFNDKFTAADLTLTSLIEPLRIVPSLFDKYKPIFVYCDRIREEHDPMYKRSNVDRLYKSRDEKQPSTIFKIIFLLFYILCYPIKYFFNIDAEKPQLQYPSTNIREKANNDNRVLHMKSPIQLLRFFITYLWHFYFTLPKQLEFIENQGHRLLYRLD